MKHIKALGLGIIMVATSFLVYVLLGLVINSPIGLVVLLCGCCYFLGRILLD